MGNERERKDRQEEDRGEHPAQEQQKQDDERRYLKRSDDPHAQEPLENEEEKRYAVRLKPADHKPSNYLWGYKDWDPRPQEDTSAPGGTANTTGSVEEEKRELERNADREDDPTSIRKRTDDPDELEEEEDP